MRYFWFLFILLSLTSCGQGPAGTNGVDGKSIQGEKGDSGNDGQGCFVTAVAPNLNAPNGGSLITCAASSSLVLNGSNGQNGEAGTPGAVISAVQLCPGVTEYPSKFIEVAFCLNGELYAVYSTHGGFLTKLPVGFYGSKGQDSSCDFHVGANCAVN